MFSCTKFKSEKNLGKNFSFFAWVNKFRKLGKILFLIVMDSEDIIQLIIKDENLIKRAYLELKKGYLINVIGILKNKKKGGFEIEVINFLLVNSSKELPFEIEDNVEISEKNRYKYRYLDLRRIIVKKNLLLKNKLLKFTRDYFYDNNFIEVDTPLLANYSPEGAKTFFVISNYTNRYYSLPQSPQIFKQMLMMGGLGKYYQIAKCFRNEDLRSNRQMEFLQLDVEMSFVKINDLIFLLEDFIRKLINFLYPNLYTINFSSLSYKESIEKYNSDKPDLRKEKKDLFCLEFVWILKYPVFIFNKFSNSYENVRHIFSSPISEHKESFLKSQFPSEDFISDSFDLVCNGEEIVSGGIRINDYEIQKKMIELIDVEKKNKGNLDFFLEALKYGCPPHGGFALGIERFLSIITNSKNIREFIAFPKNSDGFCFLSGTPNLLKKEELC